MERIKCKKCGQYLVSARGYTGQPMNEGQLVLMFQMIEGGLKEKGEKSPLDDMTDFKCGNCGGASFEIVEVK